jgi:hypothetical protein
VRRVPMNFGRPYPFFLSLNHNIPRAVMVVILPEAVKID